MDCERLIIHNLDLAWALAATLGGIYPLFSLLEHCNRQSGRDLFALIFTFVAYPWAVAIMHLDPMDKGIVYAICIFSIPLYGISIMRLVGLENPKFRNFRQLSLVVATALALMALTNPWHGQFAHFDAPIPGQPNHQLDYRTPGLGALLTLAFAGVVVLGTAAVAGLRLLRSRFVLSYSLLAVILPVTGLGAYFGSSFWRLLEAWQVNAYFLTTTTTLFYFSYLSAKGRITPSLPIAHTRMIRLMPDGILMVNGMGNVTECNPAFGALLGMPPEQILEQPLANLLPDTQFLEAGDRHLLTLKRNDQVHHLDLQITPLQGTDPTYEGKMILARDVTEQTSAYQQLQESEQSLHQANNELAWLSTTDALTGLRNRRYFQQQLEQELERYHRGGATFGLISIDLDHFKTINDCHGHQTGDAVLTQISRVLEGQCRAVDTLARMGGEEFMVLLVDCDAKQLNASAERLRKAVETHQVQTPTNRTLSITTSLGATLVHPEDSMRALMHRVDDLLYCAKRQGRNQSITL